MIKHIKKTKIISNLKILTNIIFLLLFITSCGQKSSLKSIKNKSLPKEIKLNPNTIKIIDSIYVFKNGVQKIEFLQIYEFKNGILTSGNRKYYVNDALNQTTNEIFDSNGNTIEFKTLFHFKNSTKIFEKRLDEYGNITQLKTTEDNNVNILEYKNSYIKNKLTNVSITSEKSNNVIENTSFKYDPKGNLVEEWIKNSFLDAKNLYQYNKNNKVILYKHIRNGVLNDSIIYHYNKELLNKEESYYNSNSSPIIKEFYYNEKQQLIKEVEKENYNMTEYKNYDSFGNWQIKEQYSNHKMNYLTKRTFINN